MPHGIHPTLGNRYRAYVKVDGRRSTKVFDAKRAALAWAQEQEALLDGTQLPDKTFEEAFQRYADEVTPEKRGGRWNRIRIARFIREDRIVKRRLPSLSSADLAEWRDARLKQVKPGTVAREMNLIAAVLEIARREWVWLKESPMRDIFHPTFFLLALTALESMIFSGGHKPLEIRRLEIFFVRLKRRRVEW